MEATARGRSGWFQLPTSSSNDAAALTETLGMEGRQKEELLARQRERAHDVHRQYGYQVGL